MRKINSIILLLEVIIVVTVLVSCVSAPPAAEGTGTLPDWVVNPPADTADTVYFIGAGSASDDAAARSAAASDLVSSVTRFLGVKVTSETTVTARDTLEKFTSTLDRTIHESSSAQLGDFKVVDTYAEEKNGVVNVYLLGAYDKTALEKERSRIKEVFAEQQRAISGPEAEGDSLAASGSYYLAAVKYIEAASAAAKSAVDNAKIKFERNMNKARMAVSKIQLSRMNDNLSSYISQPFDESFKCKVTADGKTLADVQVKIVYKAMGKNGRKLVRSAVLSSDEQGVVSFARPPAAFVGPEKLTINLELSAVMENLQEVSSALYPAVESLEEMIQGKRITFSYTVLSHAKEIPTGVLVIDEDNSGVFTGKTDTASGIMETLTAQKFSVQSIPVDSNFKDINDAAFIRLVRQKYGNRFERLIFGTAGIASFQEEKNMFTVKVSGDIRVVELKTGNVLYSSGTRFKTAIGSNASSAMSAAFKQFGKEIGRIMANTLP